MLCKAFVAVCLWLRCAQKLLHEAELFLVLSMAQGVTCSGVCPLLFDAIAPAIADAHGEITAALSTGAVAFQEYKILFLVKFFRHGNKTDIFGKVQRAHSAKIPEHRCNDGAVLHLGRCGNLLLCLAFDTNFQFGLRIMKRNALG